MKRCAKLLQGIVLAGLSLLMACASPQESMSKLVHDAGWKTQILQAENFDLFTASQHGRRGQTLWVYLEGDGRAYITPTRPSSDPTPSDPVAFRLALIHPKRELVAYVGRPCQYVMPVHGRGCSQNYWTMGRYAPEVIVSTNSAINVLKGQAQAANIVLVGYSGGGALAVLVASRRQDVVGIVTVAANLDIDYWARQNELSLLEGSENPADVVQLIASIPQTHFVGGKDDVVTSYVTRSYLGSMSHGHTNMILMPEFTHKCCWVEQWPELLSMTKVVEQRP